MAKYLRVHMSSPRNITFDVTEDFEVDDDFDLDSPEGDKERIEVETDFVWENVEVWTEVIDK